MARTSWCANRASSPSARGLLNTVRSDACSYFTTVLGPGYNPEHADHFHFDLMQRRSGYRACK